MLKEAVLQNPLISPKQARELISQKGAFFPEFCLSKTLQELKVEYYESLVEPYRPRTRIRCKTSSPIPCRVDRTSLSHLEPVLRQYIFRSKQMPYVVDVKHFLKQSGYVLCE